ncbi:hypothetical protein BDV97DRAFT_367523 [Delphinella strobiligena]|nr:hypothetical protein BDV97DRAFT_367523 [Delphinella strobiligena]
MAYENPPNASSPDLESTLRPDFYWGYATAAAQVEGAYNSESGKGNVIDDVFRQESFEGYPSADAQAVKDEDVDVRSHFAWTLTDNWKWAAGYTDLLGSTWHDFESEETTRWPKKSAFELMRIFGHLIGAGREKYSGRDSDYA